MTDSGGDLDARRASFLSAGEDYQRARPGYPAAAVEWLAGQEPTRIIDLGCGPGKLTAQLVRRGHSVVGVDPSLKMLRTLSRLELSGACGMAEAIPVRSSWAHVVTAAQAFHWFDYEHALPEIHRVLKPGGHLGLIWNLRDERAHWVEELSKIIGSEDAMSATIGDRERFGDDPSQGALRESSLFSDIEHRVFEFRQDLTREELLALVRSRSYVAIMPDDERRKVLAAVGRLCEEHPDLASRQTLVMPYKTHGFRAEAV